MNSEIGRTACPVDSHMAMHIQTQLEQLRSIRCGIAEIEAGHYIPHEAMKAWLLSLNSDHALPPPRCVCGESHDQPA
jgi:predicted transcriptional regulator